MQNKLRMLAAAFYERDFIDIKMSMPMTPVEHRVEWWLPGAGQSV